MGTYFLAAFLILFGIMQLVETSIPKWAVGVVALASALALLFSSIPKKPVT